MSKTKVEKHFDKVAKKYDFYKKKNSFYYENLKKLLGREIPRGGNVLEIGCGTGDLLNHLKPGKGYGFDVSSEMISISNYKFRNSKNLTFSTKWPDVFTPEGERHDYIFMSDVIEHLEEPEVTFRQISKLMSERSKFIITMANPIWEPALMLAEKLKLKMPEGPHNRITNHELQIMIEKAGMKIIKHDYKLLIPVGIPFVTNFANKYLEKYLKRLAFIEYFITVLS